MPMLLLTSVTLLVSYHVFATLFNLYKKAWQYASIGEMISIIKVVALSVAATALVQEILFHVMFLRALCVTLMILILLIGGSRFSTRISHYTRKQDRQKRTLIIGAGAAGTMVVRQLIQSPESELKPVAFIDDDPRKYKLDILGIPVVGDTSSITKVVEKEQIENIVIAIPSLSNKELQSISNECIHTKAKTQIIPKLEDIMTGKISINHFRDVQVEDLLGREPVELDIESISEYVTGKTILISGAGGSIGSEICRQICEFTPQKIVLLGHGENSIYLIDTELRSKYGDQIELIPVIGDIQDRNRIFEIMDEYRPNVVYHAAAHKHVPLMEYNPREAVKNNVFGTKNVAEAAAAFGVNTFVMISTDKAVNPTNVMGSTKRIAEMIIQKMNEGSNTKFVAVRFGNVLGSRGSVIPLFKKQIKEGGPITVTHPDITRYFMTIPEASRLVIQAGSLAQGGEIFVLDMGEPVKIVDLAKNLIQLSGFSIDEIEIHFSGLRPGEKMFEELLDEKEIYQNPVYSKIFIGKSFLDQEDEIEFLLTRFENLTTEEIKEFVINLANRKENGIYKMAGNQ
jgi:FlaA1/EpsC-like NDP-sugar epimerase